jgi:hypothetical protein
VLYIAHGDGDVVAMWQYDSRHGLARSVSYFLLYRVISCLVVTVW